jgi:folate-binding protein YgfZ
MQPLPAATMQQYEALTRGAGVADLADRDEIRLTGKDRATFLHNFCTADIKRLEAGQAAEAFFCNLQGKILGHGYVFCDEASLAIDTVAGQAEPLIKHLDRYLIREDVQLENRSEQVGKLLAAGEQSAELLERVCGNLLPAGNLRQAAARVGDIDVVIRRVDFTGPDCFFVVCDRDNLEPVRQSLIEAGAVPCEAEALEITRLEAGTPLFGRDISERNLPQEVARDARAISFTKGCYLGQETVARIDALGHVNQQLVGVRFPDDDVPAHGAELSHAGKQAGHVGSAAFSPQLDAPLALAMVRREFTAPGSRLESPRGECVAVALPVSIRDG